MGLFISNSASDTAQFAEAAASRARPGLVIGLVGDLGTGKTQFVKGFARGLGIKEPVLSPTFPLVHIYASGRLPLVHIDFYRLSGPDQIVAAGLTEYFVPAGVALVEWWDRWSGEEPPQFQRIEIEALSEWQRRITYDRAGS